MALSIFLRHYADSLAPSPDIMEKARDAVKRIQDIVHQKLGSRFSIDRIRPLGSLAKKTSLWFKMDIDVVIYLNEEMPPFDEFKQQLDDVITMNIDEHCKQTPSGLSLKINGFDVDLLPARNFLHSNGYHRGAGEVNLQVKNTLDFLKNNMNSTRRNKLEFSTSLSEGAIAFEREHSAYSHTLSRLAKAWSCTIGIHGFSFGRSSIMEYLGVWAAEEEERQGSQDVLQGFRRFLQMVQNSSGLNIVWKKYYKKKDIPSDILRQRPLLLDPTNPYNNMLEGGNGDYLREMSQFARVTLLRLDAAQRNENHNFGKLFEPQPLWPAVFSLSRGKSPRNYLAGHERRRVLIPKIETRSGARGVDPSIAKAYLFVFTDAVATAVKNDAGRGADIAARVKSVLQQFISPGEWAPSNEKHESRHMTFTIPVGKNATEVIKISCDWA